MQLRFVPGERGLFSWSLRGAVSERGDIDGLSTAISDSGPADPGEHPLGASKIDHLVVITPQLQRTVDALSGAGLELRRVREPDEPGPPLRQAFVRAGEVIVEVVENEEVGDGPARFWGITFRVAEIERAAEVAGEGLGTIREAVQPGRRIATARREAGLGLPVALID